jgi:ankyrin repeat protein
MQYMQYRNETTKHVSNQLLITKINARKWAEACTTAYNDETYVRIKDPAGNLPIHLAVKLGCTHDLLIKLVTAYPESAGIRDVKGYLPLHLVVQHHKGKLWLSLSEMATTLLLAYPQGLREFDPQKNLCIQLALRHRGPDDLVRFLLQRFPESAFIVDRHGNTLLHMAVQFEFSYAVVSELLALHPEAASIPNKIGGLPLHKAAQFNSPIDTLHLIHNAFPGGSMVQDSRGNLPLHVMFLCCGGPPDEERLRLMLGSYATGLSIANGNGCTPFMMMSRPQDNYVDDYT